MLSVLSPKLRVVPGRSSSAGEIPVDERIRMLELRNGRGRVVNRKLVEQKWAEVE